MKKIGIDAISYYVPSIYLSIEKLSEHRNLDYEKFRFLFFLYLFTLNLQTNRITQTGCLYMRSQY